MQFLELMLNDMEKNTSKIMEWWNAPQKTSFKKLLFGKETLRFIITVLITSFLVMCVMFIVQMSSLGRETEETFALIGVSIISLVGLWRAVSNMRMLNGGLEKFAYACIAVGLGYLIFQFSMFLFVAFVIYLILCFLGFAKIDIVKDLFKAGAMNGGGSESVESPDYGNFYHGATGDYIQGQNGNDLRITDDLGGGNVRTENGERYHIDDDGFAKKI